MKSSRPNWKSFRIDEFSSHARRTIHSMYAIPFNNSETGNLFRKWLKKTHFQVIKSENI